MRGCTSAWQPIPKTMLDRVLPRLERIEERRRQIESEIQQAAESGETRRMVELQVEYGRLEPTTDLYSEWQDLVRKLKDTQAVASEDPELEEMASAEADELQERIGQTESRILEALGGSSGMDDKNVFLEIRAAAGGDEASLFAGDLYRMYERYCERRSWDFEMANSSVGTHGGFKEVIVRVGGKGAYGDLQFESGGHRVQRVPETESQGRVHTSVCTVAVIPEAKTEDVTISPEDLRIETFRASGAGGQHVNKTDSAVRVTHLPTTTVVECQSDRSQHRNKEMALAVLRSRIQDKIDRENQSSKAKLRKSQVGTGERSEKIRTYNFPQGRITDHRIKLTLHKLGDMLDGGMEDMIVELKKNRAIESALETEWPEAHA